MFYVNTKAEDAIIHFELSVTKMQKCIASLDARPLSARILKK